MIHSKSLSLRAARAESFLFRTRSIGKFIQKAESSRPSPFNPLENVCFLARNYAEADARRCCCEKCPFIGLAKTKHKKELLESFQHFRWRYSTATLAREVTSMQAPAPTKTEPPNATPDGYAQLFLASLVFTALPHFPIHYASYAFCILAFEGARRAQAFFLSLPSGLALFGAPNSPQRGINGGFTEFSLLRE